MTIKVIPQKLNLPMNFFLNFPRKFSTKYCFEKNNKNDRSPFSLKRYDGQSYPIYACNSVYHAHYL